MTQLDNIAIDLAHKISDFAKSTGKDTILEEISIYGASQQDGSHVMSFEWHGDEHSSIANDILDFFHSVKKIVSESGKEATEQVPPHANIMKDKNGNVLSRILYRFRVWNESGKYDEFKRELITK